MSMFTVRGPIPLPAASGTAPTLEGTPSIGAQTSGVAFSGAIGTSQTNDIFVMATFSNTTPGSPGTTGTAPVVTNITGTSDFSGLTWSNTASPTSNAMTEVFT